MMSFLSGKKTYIVALVGIIYLLVQGWDGQMPWVDVMNRVWEAFLAIFIRAGIAKK